MPYPFTLCIVGGQGGSPFSFTGIKEAATLRQLSVMGDGCGRVQGVEVQLSDGRRCSIGAAAAGVSAPSFWTRPFEFEAGETVARLSLWCDCAGAHLGAVRLRTSRGREFSSFATGGGDHGEEDGGRDNGGRRRRLGTEYKIDVGSGICLGIQGRVGANVTCLGFLFLNAVASSVIQNVNYPTVSREPPAVQLEEVKTSEYRAGEVERHFTFESSTKVTTTSRWSTANDVASTFSLSVKAGVPELVEEASAGRFRFSVGPEHSYPAEGTEERTETLAIPVVVPPHGVAALAAAIGRASVKLPYTALLRITCANGALYDTEVAGVYRSASVTALSVTVARK